eukprot:4695319-Pleurochrysis_carterae.AAC.2
MVKVGHLGIQSRVPITCFSELHDLVAIHKRRNWLQNFYLQPSICQFQTANEHCKALVRRWHRRPGDLNALDRALPAHLRQAFSAASRRRNGGCWRLLLSPPSLILYRFFLSDSAARAGYTRFAGKRGQETRPRGRASALRECTAWASVLVSDRNKLKPTYDRQATVAQMLYAMRGTIDAWAD